MARRGHAPLHEQSRVAELGGCQSFDSVEPGGERLRVFATVHTDSAAPRGTLQHDGIADARGARERIVHALEHIAARQQGNARPRRQRTCLVLQTELAQVLRSRPDECHALPRQNFGEVGVLTEETVARMDSFGTGRRNGGNDLADVEVGVRNSARAECNRLPGGIDMQRVAIGVCVDGDRRNAERVEGAAHADRDLAPVGDEYL